MSNSTTAAASYRPWIVSAIWDLSYVVLTPALIVPLVLLAVRYALSAEQVYLAVISFASLGHHLPGFMRAYGDRELFARYRLRFLLAPPLAFATALLFTPPAGVANSLGLTWSHLHGLELVLMLWGTWHGLMQTYGFMRIYDLRAGRDDRRSANFDWAACLAIFGGGIVLSDHRMAGLATAMWQAGLPYFGRSALVAVQRSAAVLCAVVGIAYVVREAVLWRRGGKPVFAKLLLAATTAWFYWYCGRLSTNLLVGTAMFEIFHAVQYDAIVWVYNRRLFDRAGQKFGALGFLFRDRITMLGLYLAAIGAYSSIRFFTSEAGDRMFASDLADARQWLIGWFVASSLLHFYFDGFIWKVSQGPARAVLVDGPASDGRGRQFTSALAHAGKWSALAGVLGLLLLAELRAERSPAMERELSMARALAEVAPQDWEYRMELGSVLERGGDLSAAERQYREAASLTPQAAPWQALGEMLLRNDRPGEALPALEKASRLAPDSSASAEQLGLARLMLGDAFGAVEPLEQAVRLDATNFSAQVRLGDAWSTLGRLPDAAAAYGHAVRLRPDVVAARVALAEAQAKNGLLNDAEKTLREGIRMAPESPELNFALGLVLRGLGEEDEARQLLEKAAASGLKPRVD